MEMIVESLKNVSPTAWKFLAISIVVYIILKIIERIKFNNSEKRKRELEEKVKDTFKEGADDESTVTEF